MTVRVLIVEDEPECLRRLTEAVLSDPLLYLVGSVSTAQAALALIEATVPDVILVDLGLPDMDGVELIRQVARRQPHCDIVVVTMFADDAHVMASLEAGAIGYLLKDERNEHIVSALHEVHSGGAPISPSIARRVLAKFRRGDAGVPAMSPEPSGKASTPPAQAEVPGPKDSRLSEREIEILQLIAKGFNFDTVGKVLAISPHTVVSHVKKIYRKLAVHSRGEAVYEAGQIGLL